MKTDLMMIDQFNQTQDDFMNEIIESKGGNLPVKIEQVAAIFEFTDFKAKAWKMMTDKMKKLNEHSESYNSALRSGQKWGIAALYSQKRMGELLPPPEETGRGKPNTITLKNGDTKQLRGSSKRLPENINSRTAYEARALKNNPDVLDRVVKEAKEQNEIPTKATVLNEIRQTKEKERKETAIREGRTQKTEIEMSIEEQQFLLFLNSTITRMPDIPKDWTEGVFKEAQGYANIIINRLEIFNE